MGDEDRKEFCIWFQGGACIGLNMTAFLTRAEWEVIRKIADIYFPPEDRNPILFRKFGRITGHVREVMK